MVGAAALAIPALGRYAELGRAVDDFAVPLLFQGLGASLACLAAALVAWFAPALRMVAAGALIAVGAVSGWFVLWTFAYPTPTTSVGSAVGAVLVALAGVMLLMRPDRTT